MNGKLTSGHRPIPTPQRVETVDDAIDVEIGAADHGDVLSLDFEERGQTARGNWVRRMCDTGPSLPSRAGLRQHRRWHDEVATRTREASVLTARQP
jgi:hypothetical protein